MRKRKWTAVLAAGLLLVGWQALLPPPAEAELKVGVSGSIRFNAIWADADWGLVQDVAWSATPITRCGRQDFGAAAGGKDNCNVLDDSQFILDARRTRLQFDATDEVAGVKMDARVQFDFDVTEGNARNSNSRGPRIRLAYMQARVPNGLVFRVGQIRSILSQAGDAVLGNVGNFETVNDHDDHTLIDARQPGANLWWTTKFMGGDLTIGVGAEKNSISNAPSFATIGAAPAGGGTATAGTTAIAEEQGEGQKIPLFAVGARYVNPLVGLFVRYGATSTRVALEPNGADQFKTAWIAAVSADLKPIPPLTLQANYYISEGLQRLNSGADAFSDMVVLSVVQAGIPHRIDLWRPTVQAASGAITYRLTKDLRFLAAYMWAQADENMRQVTGTNNLVAATAAARAVSRETERMQGWALGAIYSFWTRWDTGIEWQLWERDFFGELAGNINMVTYRLRFYF